MLTMTSAPSRRHCVIAIGPLNSMIFSAFEQAVTQGELLAESSPPASPAARDQFLANAKNLCGKAFWLRNAELSREDLSPALVAHDVDFIWMFINASEMQAPAVLEVMSSATRTAIVLLFCYPDDRTEIAAEPCTLPAQWSSSPRLIVCHPYAESLRMLRYLQLAVRTRTARPIYQGKEAREKDEYYARARSIVLAQQRISISLVQRHCRIGYTHAARLIDAMEGDILSPAGHDGMRAILPTQDNTRCAGKTNGTP